MAGHGHDASITVWYDTDVMVEHYTSEPYHKYEDVESLKKKFGAPDLVVWYENPYLKSIRQWWAGQKNPFQRKMLFPPNSQKLRSRLLTFSQQHKRFLGYMIFHFGPT